MMKSKLFLIPCLSITAIAPICACSTEKPQAEKIADAIFGPMDLSEQKLDKSFVEALKGLSQEDLNNELVYDLFMCADSNIPGILENLNLPKTLRDLYKDEKIKVQTNITECKLALNNENKLIANFLGYVSFVFISDVNDTYKVNDYIMLTYDIKNFEVNTSHSDYLGYSPREGYSLGFIKLRQKAGQDEGLIAIDEINADDFDFGQIPHNSKNWKA